jgi:tRNA threonylcarbamoyladenosine biosynthesis protein TsaB
MHVLALDSTTRAGSVAVAVDGRVVVERIGDAARSHAERLPADIVDALHDAGVGAGAIDLYAVAAGPGAVTGLRIGIATIQGLAFVAARRIAAVSALEGLAQLAARDAPPGSLVAAWMDAHRGEVFSALYRVLDAPPFTGARLAELAPAAVASPEQTLDGWASTAFVPDAFVGDGARLYWGVIRGRCPGAVLDELTDAPSLAGALALMAADRAARGETVTPAGVQPLYVRRPDAEAARDRDRAEAQRVRGGAR